MSGPDPPSRRARPGEPVEAEVEAALEALSAPDRLRGAELRVARFAPQLQRILAGALQEGGWFDEAHESRLRAIAGSASEEERIVGLRTLLADETRLGMLVGVAVGWELARELDGGVRVTGRADVDSRSIDEGSVLTGDGEEDRDGADR